MSPPVVILREMRQDEYDGYTAEREAEYVASMARVLPPEVARDRARQGTSEFLPQGLATERHRLLMAENAAGELVGAVWLGLDEPRSGSSEMAWLYDIRVAEPHRRAGYGRAILAAVEEVAREAGAPRLGLNVFGYNQPAISLYESSGYEVTAQQMAKRIA